MYGRAQPFGQPVMRMTISSFRADRLRQRDFSNCVNNTRAERVRIPPAPDRTSARPGTPSKRGASRCPGSPRQRRAPPAVLLMPFDVASGTFTSNKILRRRQPHFRPKLFHNLAQARSSICSFGVSLMRPIFDEQAEEIISHYVACASRRRSPCLVNLNGRAGCSLIPTRRSTSSRNHSAPRSSTTYFRRACLRFVRSPKSR